jgi:UDP-N-acetylglucosamine:LPS N-acetylglucosamine transferase
MTRTSRCDVLAISSPGGHWVELTRLFPAFEGLTVEYATTDAGRAVDVPTGRLHVLTDANKQTPWRLVICSWQILQLIASLRPRVIVSTGAAPGFIAIVLGKLFGARAVWLDIFGLVDRMTLSGRMVKPFANLYLVQWPHLAKPDGPHFRGSLL